MKIYLIRHAEVEKNIQKRHGSVDDFGMITTSGYIGLDRLKRYLTSNHIRRNLILSSSSPSCINTAKILKSNHHSVIHQIDSLKSIYFGVVSGLREEDIKRCYPDIYSQFNLYHNQKLHPKNYKITDAESIEDFEKRIISVFNYILIHYSDYKEIIIVTHRSVITMTLNILKAIPLSIIDLPYLVYNLPNCSISTVELSRHPLESKPIQIAYSPSLQGLATQRLTNPTFLYQ